MEEEESLTDDKIDKLEPGLFDNDLKIRSNVINDIKQIRDSLCGAFLFQMWKNPDFLKEVKLFYFLNMVYDEIPLYRKNLLECCNLVINFFECVSKISSNPFNKDDFGTDVFDAVSNSKQAPEKKVNLFFKKSFDFFKEGCTDKCLKKKLSIVDKYLLTRYISLLIR